MSNEIIVHGFPEVIVRSFGDEPVALVAHRLDSRNKRVLVGIEGAKRPISLPVEDVFDFEDERFAELLERLGGETEAD